jgi:hypothetical protein
MRISFARVAAIGMISVALAGRAAAEERTASLAPPVAIAINGMSLDAAFDGKGVLVHDNACPWVGDFDGNGKLALLIGHRSYTFPPPGKEREGRPGRLRIYRSLAGNGPLRLTEPIWFDSLVPTGRIPQG